MKEWMEGIRKLNNELNNGITITDLVDRQIVSYEEEKLTKAIERAEANQDFERARELTIELLDLQMKGLSK